MFSEDSMTIQHEHRGIPMLWNSCINAVNSVKGQVSSPVSPQPQPHSPSGCLGPLVQKPWICQDQLILAGCRSALRKL